MGTIKPTPSDEVHGRIEHAIQDGKFDDQIGDCVDKEEDMRQGEVDDGQQAKD